MGFAGRGNEKDNGGGMRKTGSWEWEWDLQLGRNGNGRTRNETAYPLPS
jgi:hypothetical protein